MHTHTHTCTHTHTDTLKHRLTQNTHIYAHKHIQVHTDIHIHIHTHTHTNVHTHSHTDACAHTDTCAHTATCAHTDTCAHRYMWKSRQKTLTNLPTHSLPSIYFFSNISHTNIANILVLGMVVALMVAGGLPPNWLKATTLHMYVVLAFKLLIDVL